MCKLILLSIYLSEGNDKPKYVELCELIPQHAAHWEDLGAHLGLEDYVINNIRRNHPNQCEDACREMFMKWLQVDPSPTWRKLDDAIQSMTFNSSSMFIPCIATLCHIYKLSDN